MHLNCQPNCYSYFNFCNCRELHSIPPPNCCPSNCCCCCPICGRRLTPKVRKMPIKPKTTNGATAALAASKNTSKPKTKTIKSKKLIRNDKQEDQNDIQESALALDGPVLKSNQPLSSHRSLHSSNTSLKTSQSFCGSSCFRTGVTKSGAKQKLSLNNSFAKPQEEEYSALADSPRGSRLSHSHGSSQSRQDGIQKQSRNSFNKSSLNTKTQMYAPSLQNQSTRTCKCCNKTTLPVNISSTNISRHWLALGAQNHSPLDVIDEEDSDTENTRRQYSSTENYTALDSFWHSRPETENVLEQSSVNKNQYPSLSKADKTRVQKSLEDSCADFLNIVCDNIMESVEKSVDCKLKEFMVQAIEKLTTVLTQKLEENVTVLHNLVQAMTENVNKLNERNYEDFYSRMQNIFSKENANRINETPNKESQFEEHNEGKGAVSFTPQQSFSNVEEGDSNISEQFSNSALEEGSITSEQLSNNTQEGGSNISQPLSHNVQDQSSNLSQQLSSKAQEEGSSTTEQQANTAHDTRDNEGNLLKCTCCDCCFEDENSCHPCGPDEINNETPKNPSNPARESGGCFVSRETESVKKTEEVKLRNSFGEGSETKSAQQFCSPQYSTKQMNLCFTPSGQLNCFGNSSCNRNADIKWNSFIIYDNYDTSGYATEPEDNSEVNDANSGRKKLQKKSIKQHSLNRQTSAANNSDDAADTLDDVSERSSSRTLKRLSRSSLRGSGSSPTRLSRL